MNFIKNAKTKKTISHPLLKHMTYHVKDMSNAQNLMTSFCLPPAFLYTS